MLLCDNSTITHEVLSFILFYSSVQDVLYTYIMCRFIFLMGLVNSKCCVYNIGINEGRSYDGVDAMS